MIVFSFPDTLVYNLLEHVDMNTWKQARISVSSFLCKASLQLRNLIWG